MTEEIIPYKDFKERQGREEELLRCEEQVRFLDEFENVISGDIEYVLNGLPTPELKLKHIQAIIQKIDINQPETIKEKLYQVWVNGRFDHDGFKDMIKTITSPLSRLFYGTKYDQYLAEYNQYLRNKFQDHVIRSGGLLKFGVEMIGRHPEISNEYPFCGLNYLSNKYSQLADLIIEQEKRVKKKVDSLKLTPDQKERKNFIGNLKWKGDKKILKQHLKKLKDNQVISGNIDSILEGYTLPDIIFDKPKITLLCLFHFWEKNGYIISINDRFKRMVNTFTFGKGQKFKNKNLSGLFNKSDILRHEKLQYFEEILNKI
jgi:hypothetical protein